MPGYGLIMPKVAAGLRRRVTISSLYLDVRGNASAIIGFCHRPEPLRGCRRETINLCMCACVFVRAYEIVGVPTVMGQVPTDIASRIQSSVAMSVAWKPSEACHLEAYVRFSKPRSIIRFGVTRGAKLRKAPIPLHESAGFSVAMYETREACCARRITTRVGVSTRSRKVVVSGPDGHDRDLFVSKYVQVSATSR